MIWKKNKYGAKSCKCAEGHIHDSIGEAGYCDYLHVFKRAGHYKAIKQQVRYMLAVNGHKICEHKVDFEVELPGGRLEIHEFKGFETDVWKIKLKLMRALYPETVYKVIKGQPGRYITKVIK